MKEPGGNIGMTILALLTSLVGVLGLFMAGAMWLVESAASSSANPLVIAWLLAFGLLYLLLAYTLLAGHSLAPKLAVLLLVATVVVGTQGYPGAERMALGVTLVLALAAVTNIAVIMALHLPGNRERFKTMR